MDAREFEVRVTLGLVGSAIVVHIWSEAGMVTAEWVLRMALAKLEYAGKGVERGDGGVDEFAGGGSVSGVESPTDVAAGAVETSAGS